MKRQSIFLPMLFFLFLALIFSLVVLVERLQIEGANPVVDLVLDNQSFQQLVREEGLEEEPFLRTLIQSGISSIAFQELDLEGMMKRNLLVWTTPQRIRELYYLTEVQFPSLQGQDFLTGREEGTFLFTPFPEVASFLLQSLPLRGKGPVHTLHQEDSSFFFYVEEAPARLKELPLGHLDDYSSFMAAGLVPLPRIRNQELQEEQLRSIWEGIYQEPSTIIFGGSEVFGYEDALPLTIDLIQEGDHLLGFIEPFIAQQQGVSTLARGLDTRITRVHSIQQEEMEVLSENRVIARYVRAVRERNIRTLYLRLFPVEDAVYQNQVFVENLVLALEGAGYRIGPAQPFPPFETSPWRLFFINLGVWAGFILFLRLFYFQEKHLLFLFLLGLLFSSMTLYLGFVTFNQQAMGLLTAVIFPSWGILLVLRERLKKDTVEGFFPLFFQGAQYLARATLLTLLGGLLLVGIFSRLSYLLQVDQFRGIKLAFLLPLILIAAGFFYLNRGIPWTRNDLLGFLQEPICVKHLLWGGILLVAAFIYLGRTGNFPLIPVPELELIFRERLETMMVFRPRFKEFLVGHPFFLLAVFFSSRRKLLPIFMILGSIGQLSIINSFAHLHSPLLVSLWRTAASLLLGGALGLLLLVLCHRGVTRWGRVEKGGVV